MDRARRRKGEISALLHPRYIRLPSEGLNEQISTLTSEIHRPTPQGNTLTN